jgi:hypothetical protein
MNPSLFGNMYVDVGGFVGIPQPIKDLIASLAHYFNDKYLGRIEQIEKPHIIEHEALIQMRYNNPFFYT